MRLIVNEDGRLSGLSSQEPRNMMLTVPILLIAFFAIIVAMHRGVTRRADEKLRAQFDSHGSGGEVSRQLMRNSGYSV
ncbi:hypothetical protein [Paraburkholderia hiiakae]|nr:hypothetical protein [Paraburkholderia hiiakae]